ncbi:hypothetical protein I4U23_011563 [Adineta vaga]|nr:hypothetical protein I4U23_011563 [Adineta vaga]
MAVITSSIPFILVLWISTIIHATSDWAQSHITTTGKIFTIFAVGVILSMTVIVLAVIVFFMLYFSTKQNRDI